MAVIEYDEYKQKLNAMETTFANLHKALGIDAAKAEIERLEAETNEDGFWNDIERSQKNQQQSKRLQNKVSRHMRLVRAWDDLKALVEMGIEMDDESSVLGTIFTIICESFVGNLEERYIIVAR